MLSTQILIGADRTKSGSLARQTSGPTSSKADILLDNPFPLCLTPVFIFRPQGK